MRLLLWSIHIVIKNWAINNIKNVSISPDLTFTNTIKIIMWLFHECKHILIAFSCFPTSYNITVMVLDQSNSNLEGFWTRCLEPKSKTTARENTNVCHFIFRPNSYICTVCHICTQRRHLMKCYITYAKYLHYFKAFLYQTWPAISYANWSQYDIVFPPLLYIPTYKTLPLTLCIITFLLGLYEYSWEPSLSILFTSVRCEAQWFTAQSMIISQEWIFIRCDSVCVWWTRMCFISGGTMSAKIRQSFMQVAQILNY